MKEPIFDAHLHITLKPILTGYNDSNFPVTVNPWEKFKVFLPGIGRTLRSQSNLTQLDKANMRLFVHALHSPDYAIIDAGLIDKFATFVITKFKKKAVKRIKFDSPVTNMEFDLACVQAAISEPDGNGKKKLNVLTNWSDFDDNNMNVVFNVEGGHNFFDQDDQGVHFIKWEKLDDVKKDDHPRIVFINLTHLQQWWLATHAYGLKLLDNCLSNFEVRYMFKPAGYGIQPDGITFMNKAIAKSNVRRRILIDIKHMSLVSRLQYYAWRRTHVDGAQLPIVASHVGLTGASFRQIKQRILDTDKIDKFEVVRVYHGADHYGGHLDDTHFNPNTINLYNEEIRMIVASNGLIGISLDSRILGAKNKENRDGQLFSDEYFSNEEHKLLFNDDQAIYDFTDAEILNRTFIDQKFGFNAEDTTSIRKVIADFVNTEYTSEDRSRGVVPEDVVEADYEEIELNNQVEHFVNTVLHLTVVAGEEAWSHMCIGSDFDGLITPLKKINNVTDMQTLRDSLEFYIKTHTEKWSAFNVRSYVDIEDKVDRLFYRNGFEFVKRAFG